RRFHHRVSALLRVRRRLEERPARAQGASETPRSARGRAGARSQGRRREAKEPDLVPRSGRGQEVGTLSSELAAHASRLAARPRIYADANVPAGLVAHMRARLDWDVLWVLEEEQLRRASDVRHYQLARQLRRTLVTMDRDYLDDRRFPPREGCGVIVIQAPNDRELAALL